MAGEILDSSVLNMTELKSFLAKEITSAKEQGVLFSIHLKATMMKEWQKIDNRIDDFMINQVDPLIQNVDDKLDQTKEKVIKVIDKTKEEILIIVIKEVDIGDNKETLEIQNKRYGRWPYRTA